MFQTLLQNNASAAFFNAQLSGTEWRVSDVSDFLSKASEDQRSAGSAYTWRDVFNETDQAIQTITRFMEVSVSVALGIYGIFCQKITQEVRKVSS